MPTSEPEADDLLMIIRAHAAAAEARDYLAALDGRTGDRITRAMLRQARALAAELAATLESAGAA